MQLHGASREHCPLVLLMGLSRGLGIRFIAKTLVLLKECAPTLLG
jgi:hypothetical protein